MICAKEIHKDTSLSSSYVSALTSGSGVLHLIWSGVAKCVSFPFSRDCLHGRQIFPLENVLSFSVKQRYSASKSGVKDLVFFEKFN
jgi:hypothetical protein